MALFGKKKESSPDMSGDIGGYPEQPQAPEPPGGTPVDKVVALQRQGMSNYQIVQTLQQQGFSSQQIYDAINQASVKGGVRPSPAENEWEAPSAPPGGPPPGMPPLPPPSGGGMQPMEGIEETVEAVVEEKWKEISSTLAKLNDWKETVDSRLSKFEQSMKDLKGDMDNLHKAIVAKIGEYDQNLLSVGTEIKAMEKVFSKVLPTFTENVNELARVAKGIRKK